MGPASTFRREDVEADTFRRLSIEEDDDECPALVGVDDADNSGSDDNETSLTGAGRASLNVQLPAHHQVSSEEDNDE